MSNCVRRPSHKKIVEANADLLKTLDVVGDATRECWACGFTVDHATGLERAHVVASSHDGSDDPDNFFLLCGHCHSEQPDGLTREEQLRWLRTAPSCDEWAQGLADYVFGSARKRLPHVTDEQFKAWSFTPDAPVAVVRGFRSAAGPTNTHANVIAAVVSSLLLAYPEPTIELEAAE